MRVKIFSSFDVLKNDYYCPVCGDKCQIVKEVKIPSGLPGLISNLGEFILVCDGCSCEIDYLMTSKPNDR